MTDDMMRAIGRLEGKMDTVCSTVTALDGKIDQLQTRGCAVGDENRRRIKHLEDGPRRVVAGATVGAGGITAAVWGILEGIRAWLARG